MTEEDCTKAAADLGLLPCPAGCALSELETGTNNHSFMAAFGAPPMHLRCGQCGFTAPTAYGNDAAIEKWNEAVREARP